MIRQFFTALLSSVFLAAFSFADDKPAEPLPGTELLTMEGDIAAQLVEGVDKFLLRKIDESVANRERHWKRDFSSPEAYEKSIEPNRKRLAHILGVRDERLKFDAPELVGTIDQPALIAETENCLIYRVRWPVFGDVHGEGLLIRPREGEPIANVVAIPDADTSPEQITGLLPALAEILEFRAEHYSNEYARCLAELGCQVIVPTIISRDMQKRNGRAELTNREFLYRSSFELGRHIIGYEVQKVLAAIDWFKASSKSTPCAVVGYGEGGMIALFSAALDRRVEGVFVSGYFDDRKSIWREPIDRNVFGLLDQFGDAEVVSLIFPRALHSRFNDAPRLFLKENGGAPGRLFAPNPKVALTELERGSRLVEVDGKRPDWAGTWDVHWSRTIEGNPDPTHRFICTNDDVRRLLEELKIEPRKNIQVRGKIKSASTLAYAKARQLRQLHELDRHNQQLLAESPYVRAEFMKKLDTSSIEAYQKSVEPYREIFAKEVIGQFDDPLLEPKPRTRKSYDNEKWTGYEVVLDVFPDVIAYGILCVPKDLDLAGKEKRPVVVCQHGLEGRPQDTIGEQGSEYYSAFAGKLAERGFITFAPQNLYIGKDKFRTLQRKANPLGKTLFSIIVPQHQQIVNWLGDLPFVDKDRIAFYGLSYGGKSAMRIPPLVKNYCLSICSADFNEWVGKNASTRSPYSYVWTGEYEIFEFDLGSTFNYAEMAALIAPRPFMVERGHFDGVGSDENVAYEYAKVQNLYNARLKIPDRCAIEYFVGPHKINGVGTFDFLHKHLNWPKPSSHGRSQ